MGFTVPAAKFGEMIEELEGTAGTVARGGPPWRYEAVRLAKMFDVICSMKASQTG